MTHFPMSPPVPSSPFLSAWPSDPKPNRGAQHVYGQHTPSPLLKQPYPAHHLSLFPRQSMDIPTVPLSWGKGAGADEAPTVCQGPSGALPMQPYPAHHLSLFPRQSMDIPTVPLSWGKGAGADEAPTVCQGPSGALPMHCLPLKISPTPCR